MDQLISVGIASFWVVWLGLLWHYRYHLHQMRMPYKMALAIGTVWACSLTAVLPRLQHMDNPAQHLFDTVFSTALGTGIAVGAAAGIWWLGKTYTVRPTR